jgi:LysR family transcriptional regulator, nitrogen assimilation regulatory protein
VLEGYGHAVLPLSSLRSHGDVERYALRPIVKPRLSIQVSLVTSAQRPATPLTQKVLAFIPELASRVLGNARAQP